MQLPIDLSGLSFVVLDLETQRLSDEVDGGWGNVGAFGLSVACTWDTSNGFRDWYEDQVQDLVAHMKRFDKIVGFNILGFDYRVLEPYCSTASLRGRTIDILAAFRRCMGHRVSLDSLALATLGRSKSGHGTEAVHRWRAGDRDWVVKYCRGDVEITRDIFLYVLRNRCLKYPIRGGVATAPISFDLK